MLNLVTCFTGSLTPTPSVSTTTTTTGISTSMTESKHTTEYKQSSINVHVHSTDRERSAKMTTVTPKTSHTSKQSVSAREITMGTEKQNRTTPFSSFGRSTLPGMDTTQTSITNAPTTISGSNFTYNKGKNTTYTNSTPMMQTYNTIIYAQSSSKTDTNISTKTLPESSTDTLKSTKATHSYERNKGTKQFGTWTMFAFRLIVVYFLLE